MRATVPCVYLLLAACLLVAGPSALHAEQPPPRALSPATAAVMWGVAQLIPSPVLVTGGTQVGGGMRWQLTLLVWAYGLVERPIRSLIVHPIARHAGALELFASPAWLCCASGGQTSWMLNLGSRVYVPIVGRGENWAASFGASYHRASPRDGVAFELGLYTLSSIVGLTITAAPWLTGREVSTALTLRFF